MKGTQKQQGYCHGLWGFTDFPLKEGEDKGN